MKAGWTARPLEDGSFEVEGSNISFLVACIQKNATSDQVAYWRARGFKASPSPFRVRSDAIYAQSSYLESQLSASTLVDFLSIDTLVAAKHREFSAQLPNELLVAARIVNPESDHLTVSVTGMPPATAGAPADVLEVKSTSRSGHWSIAYAGGAAGSTTIARHSRAECEPATINDFRYAYSHSFVASDRIDQSPCLSLTECKHWDATNLLAWLLPSCGIRSVHAFGAWVEVESLATNAVAISGRVPSELDSRWHTLSDAANAGIERKFSLQAGERLVIGGTYYPRKEVSWERLSGREYQPDGHFHGAILPNNSLEDQCSAAFHVRGISVSGLVRVSAHIFPCDQVYRIWRSSRVGSSIFCATTGRLIGRI